MEKIIAKAQVSLNVPAEKVWQALTDPKIVKQYMFGTEMTADWKVGGEVVYKGEWDGVSYQDRGKILEIEPPKRLVTTYFSSLSGKQDIAENYITISYNITETDGVTTLTVEQESPDQKSAEATEQSWNAIFEQLRQMLSKD